MPPIPEQLAKCRASIRAHVARGGTQFCKRGRALSARFDGLRFQALETDGVWQSYCRSQGDEIGHTAFDLFA